MLTFLRYICAAAVAACTCVLPAHHLQLIIPASTPSSRTEVAEFGRPICTVRSSMWQHHSLRCCKTICLPTPHCTTEEQTRSLLQVSPQVKPLLDSLHTLYQTCASAPQSQVPNKKREMDDNSKKMGQLFWKLNAGCVHSSADTVCKLLRGSSLIH